MLWDVLLVIVRVDRAWASTFSALVIVWRDGVCYGVCYPMIRSPRPVIVSRRGWFRWVLITIVTSRDDAAIAFDSWVVTGNVAFFCLWLYLFCTEYWPWRYLFWGRVASAVRRATWACEQDDGRTTSHLLPSWRLPRAYGVWCICGVACTAGSTVICVHLSGAGRRGERRDPDGNWTLRSPDRPCFRRRGVGEKTINKYCTVLGIKRMLKDNKILRYVLIFCLFCFCLVSLHGG